MTDHGVMLSGDEAGMPVTQVGEGPSLPVVRVDEFLLLFRRALCGVVAHRNSEFGVRNASRSLTLRGPGRDGEPKPDRGISHSFVMGHERPIVHLVGAGQVERIQRA